MERELSAGRTADAPGPTIDARSAALLFVGALEGALVLARTGTSPDDLRRAVDRALTALVAEPS